MLNGQLMKDYRYHDAVDAQRRLEAQEIRRLRALKSAILNAAQGRRITMVRVSNALAPDLELWPTWSDGR